MLRPFKGPPMMRCFRTVRGKNDLMVDLSLICIFELIVREGLSKNRITDLDVLQIGDSSPYFKYDLSEYHRAGRALFTTVML